MKADEASEASEADEFQSAGRIIGWLKRQCEAVLAMVQQFQSAGRIIGWLKYTTYPGLARLPPVSIRRADYWLVEAILPTETPSLTIRFNPPGGLLVG